jgi:hypothetical protein
MHVCKYVCTSLVFHTASTVDVDVDVVVRTGMLWAQFELSLVFHTASTVAVDVDVVVRTGMLWAQFELSLVFHTASRVAVVVRAGGRSRRFVS